MTDCRDNPLSEIHQLKVKLEAAYSALDAAKGRLMEASDLYLMGHLHNAMAISRDVAVEIGKFRKGAA